MIRYLTHELIDKQAWDKCVMESENGMIFGMSYFLDQVFPHWSGIVMGDYDAVMMVPVKRKLKVLYAFQPFFVRHVGIYHKAALTQEQMQSMLDEIPTTIKWVKLFVDPIVFSPKSKWKTEHRMYQRLNIDREMKEVEDSYSTNARRNIKKAEKQELILQKEMNPVIVSDMFRKYKGGELDVFSAEDYTRLTSLMETCIHHQAGETWSVADPHGNKLAAGFFCLWGDTVTFLKGAITDEGKTKGAMHFLFSRIIRHYHSTYHYLDFGGSNVPSVARFYQSLGGEDRYYIQAERNLLPGIITFLRKKI